MAKYSKETVDTHKALIKGVIVQDPTLSIRGVHRELQKKHQLKLARGYIHRLINSVREEANAQIERETVQNLLGGYQDKLNRMRKRLWDIIEAPPVRYGIVKKPNPKNKEELITITEKLKTSDTVKLNAIRVLKDLEKEYLDKMILVGGVSGSENIDKALLGPAQNTVNLTQINLSSNSTEEEILKAEEEILKETNRYIEELKQYEKQNTNTKSSTQSIECKKERAGEKVSSRQSTVSGDASNNVGVYKSQGLPGDRSGDVREAEIYPE